MHIHSTNSVCVCIYIYLLVFIYIIYSIHTYILLEQRICYHIGVCRDRGSPCGARFLYQGLGTPIIIVIIIVMMMIIIIIIIRIIIITLF